VFRQTLYAKIVLLTTCLVGLILYVGIGLLSPKEAARRDLQNAFHNAERQINQFQQSWGSQPDWAYHARETLISSGKDVAPFSLWLYQRDSLLAWSKEDRVFPGDITSRIDTLPSLHVDSLGVGWYACWSKKLTADYYLIATLPLTKTHLPMPQGWQFSRDKQPLFLSSLSGKQLCYINTPNVWLPPHLRIITIILLGLLSLSAVVSANAWANELVGTDKNWKGLAISFLTACGIILGWQIFAQRAGWEIWAFFEPMASLPRPLCTPSQWVIATLLLLWISALFNRIKQPDKATVQSTGVLGRLLLIQGLCAGIMWTYLYSWGRLLQDAKIHLQANTIFEIPPLGVAIVACGLLLAITVFILVHRLQTGLIFVVKSLSLRLSTAAAIAVGAALLPSAALNLSMLELGLVVFLFLVFFDLYADQEAPGLIWLFVWIALIAAFCASFTHNILSNSANQADLSPYPGVMPLFSLSFSLLVALVIGVLSLNHYTHTISSLFHGLKPSLRHRLQQYLIVYTLLGFAFIGWVTGSYFKESTSQLNQLRREEKISHLSATVRYVAPEIVQKELPSLAANYNAILGLYSAQGLLQQTATIPGVHTNGLLPVMPPGFLLADTGAMTYVFRSDQSTFIPVSEEGGKVLAYVGLSEESAEIQLNTYFYPLLETFLTLYIFLLLASGAVAIAMSNSITKPIEQIGDKLGRVELGQNELLEWHTRDEIGELVAQYNAMIAKLEDSARQLKLSEREGAWREMAKQVAHEIKNPLTPMKLSVQLLQHAVKTRPEEANQLMTRTAQTLIEQIDNLARIASEFSHFAQMPRPENEECNLNLIVQAVGDLFGKSQPEHGVTVTCQLPPTPLLVFADRSQLLRVLNNLVKNAIQAIPDGKQGIVNISLAQQDQKAVITVADNGEGIPDELQEKVFFPNFTTKSSGMGLGLAMSKNIVEAAGGNLYFFTEKDKGTSFFVELPLIMKNEE
jgi:signal transduction histidine kinase